MEGTLVPEAIAAVAAAASDTLSSPTRPAASVSFCNCLDTSLFWNGLMVVLLLFLDFFLDCPSKEGIHSKRFMGEQDRNRPHLTLVFRHRFTICFPRNNF